MNITEDYVSYEVAKLLKEKGFEGICDYAYSNKGNYFEVDRSNFDEVYCLRPTLQMAMKWLREKGIYICPKLCCFCGSKKKDRPYSLWEPRVIRLPSNNIIYPQPMEMCKHYKTYEDAVEAALKYTLENLENLM